MTPVAAHYHNTFLELFQRKPAIDYGRAGRVIQRLPAHVTADELKRAIDIQLRERRKDQFAKRREAIDLHEIAGMVDQIIAWAESPTTSRAPRVGEHGYQRQPNSGYDFSKYNCPPPKVNNG